VDEVLDDELRGRPVVELLAFVHADVDPQPAAALADAIGLGQFVVPGLARQDLRRAAAPVRTAPSRGLRRRCRLDRRRGRVLVRGRICEQQELVGITALAARAVQATQQQVEPVPQRLVVALLLVERRQQLHHHALERGRVVGQVLGGGRLVGRGGAGEAHADRTQWQTGFDS
jgi:hypothetical protein